MLTFDLVGCCRYWDTLLEMFYPRFEYLLQLNIQSIRDCEPQKLGHIDVRPHYVSTHGGSKINWWWIIFITYLLVVHFM